MKTSPLGVVAGGFFMSGARLDPDPGGVQRRLGGSEKAPRDGTCPLDFSLSDATSRSGKTLQGTSTHRHSGGERLADARTAD
jgi:hypothetical protein